MALTLAEAAKLSNDLLLAGVIESIIKDSPVLQQLPFVEIVGNGLTYNRENVAPTAAFYAVGDAWTESTPTFTQITTSLTILGGDADVDNYVKNRRLQYRLLHHSRHAARRGRPRRPLWPRRPSGGARGQPGDQGRHPYPGEVVRLHSPVQHPETRQTHRR